MRAASRRVEVRRARRPASGTSTPAMRLARTTSNGGSRLGRLPTLARIRRTSRLRRALASVDSMAIGSVSTPRASAAPSFAAAMARMPDPQPTSRTRAPPMALRVGASASRAARQSRVVGMEARPERHPGIEREDDVVGLSAVAPPGRADDEPPADAQDREVLPSTPRPSPPRARSGSAARRWSAARTPGGGRAPRRSGPRPPRPRTRRARARSRGRRPVASGRRAPRAPRRRDRTRARPIVPPRRDAAEDLADRLDRLDVGLDRELQPRAGPGRRRRSRSSASPTGRASRGSRRPPTVSPASFAYASSRLALLLAELGRHDDIDQHVEVAARARSGGGAARPGRAAGSRCRAGCRA